MTTGSSSRLAKDPAHDRRQRRLLLGLAVLFFAPLAMSFYLYYGPVAWRPGKRVNHGDLIDPPRPLPVLSLPIAGPPAVIGAGRVASPSPDPAFGAARLRSKWTLLYVGPGSCGSACRNDLYNSRQVRIALNRDMDRVQRVFIAQGECCDWPFLEAEHPDLITVRALPGTAPLIALLPRFANVEPSLAERIYLVDPLGNLMMSYAPDAKPKGMLQDLKRLLGLSHVG